LGERSPDCFVVADKTYFFFSHTIKAQPYNQGFIKAVVDKKYHALDYE
jgi:hypothetical protein